MAQSKIEYTWDALKSLCDHNVELFKTIAPHVSSPILNYTKTESVNKYNLFGHAVNISSVELVEYFLDQDLLSITSLHHDAHGINVFALACMKNLSIVKRMLDSNKVNPSVINDMRTGLHPFIFLIENHKNMGVRDFNERLETFKYALGSKKFMLGCTDQQVCLILKNLLTHSYKHLEFMKVVLDHEQMTSNIIEKSFGPSSIIELCCISNVPDSLKYLLDSMKITPEYINVLRPKLRIELYCDDVRRVLNTHVKFTNGETHGELLNRVNELSIRNNELSIHVNELSIRTNELEIENNNLKRQLLEKNIEELSQNKYGNYM